jgi:hypothetical protein
MQERNYCSVCSTVSSYLTKKLRLLPEPHMSWDCYSCVFLPDEQVVEVQKRDLQPCINCHTLTKKLSVDSSPMCSVECLVQKELDNEPRKVT